MKKNKGFTVVELIVSFSLVMIIAVFLFQIIIILRTLYINSGLKTQMLNRQAILSNMINKELKAKNIIDITTTNSCKNSGITSEVCITFYYGDSQSLLVISPETNTIIFNDYVAEFPEGTSFGQATTEVINNNAITNYKKNSILIITVPISNSAFTTETNFDLRVVYTFSSQLYPDLD